MANYTILLIDYEPRSIERLRAPLERAGYRIEVATDGQAGIIKFHALKPAAVIIEAMLPKRHGFEVCHELKQTPHGTTCPVMIATSVYRGRKYRHQAMHMYSCDAYLEKPIADEDLIHMVETSLQDYHEARARAEAEALEIDTTLLGDETAVDPTPRPHSGAPIAPAQPAQTQPSSQPATPPQPAPQPTAQPQPAPQPAPQASPGSPPQAATGQEPADKPAEEQDDVEFEILDRLDSLLSDDPSKNSPSGE